MSSLPKGWGMMPLGDVGRWYGGGTPSKANPKFWTGGTIPWVSPKDMKRPLIEDTEDHITKEAVAQSATNLVEAGSVLLVVRSGILQHTLPVAIAGRQVTLNQDIKAVMPKDDVRSDYLALALKAFEQEILHTCTKTGTTVQSLELPVFLRFEIPVAPIEEQRTIVEEIEKQSTRLEAGVAALKRTQANLKRYRASVLKTGYEGRLVPTEADIARAEGRSYESGGQFLARILTERRKNWTGRRKYKEPVSAKISELPKIPEGWTWAAAEQLCSQITDGEHIQPRYQKAGFPMLTAKNVRDGFVDYGNAGLIAENDFQGCLKRCAPEEGDVLIVSVGATTGRTAIVGPCKPFALVRSVLLLKPVMDNRYLFRWLQSPWCQSLIQRASGSTAQAHLYIKDTRTIPVPLPPLTEQLRILEEVERRLSILDQLEATVTANLQRAIRLRQSILQKAFSPRNETP